jgi:hypothetical protein
MITKYFQRTIALNKEYPPSVMDNFIDLVVGPFVFVYPELTKLLGFSIVII